MPVIHKTNGKFVAKYKELPPMLSLIERGKIIPTLLYDLLAQPTPGGSEHLMYDIIAKYTGLELGKHLVRDALGNLRCRIIHKDGSEPTTIFSCHLDTVHDTAVKIKLAVVNDNHNVINQRGMVFAQAFDSTVGYSPSVLGADDKLGIFIMCKLIKARKPGLYIFHVGEETGGTGSRYYVKENINKLGAYKRVIAFDRANYGDVICQQNPGRCASIEFGKSLAAALNEHMPPKQQFMNGIRGTFTDSANYRSVVPECVNLSVGYFNQHGCMEHFDPVWLMNFLMPAIMKLNWESLQAHRDPKAQDPVQNYSYHSYDTRWKNGENSIAKVAYAEVKANTPYFSVPLWKPEDGWPDGVSLMQMDLIIEKWLRMGTAFTCKGAVIELLKHVYAEKLTKPKEDKIQNDWDKIIEASDKVMNYLIRAYGTNSTAPKQPLKDIIIKKQEEAEFYYNNYIDIGGDCTEEQVENWNAFLNSFTMLLYEFGDSDVGLQTALTASVDYLHKHLDEPGFAKVKREWEEEAASYVINSVPTEVRTNIST